MSNENNPYSWVAWYNDGTFLEQGSYQDSKFDYAAIDRNKLAAFEIREIENKKTIFKLHLEPGQRLIYRRRVWQDFNTGQIIGYVYMVGWQQTIEGRNIQAIAHILPDGHVELAGKWSGGEPEYRADEK